MNNIFKLLSIRLLMNLSDSIFYIVSLLTLTNMPNSEKYVGILIFCVTLPEIFLFLIGPLIDALNPRKILVSSVIIQIFSIILFFNDAFRPPHVIGFILIFVMTLAAAVTYPLEDVILPKIIPKNKNVLVNSIFNISYKSMDVIFNSLIVFAMTVVSMTQFYQANLLILLITLVIIWRFTIKFTHTIQIESFSDYMTEIKSGLSYTLQHKTIRKLSIPLILFNFFNGINAVCLPFFIKRFEHSNSIYATVLIVIGVSGILGNIGINFIVHRLSSSTLLIGSMFLSGLTWIVAYTTDSMALYFIAVFTSYFLSSIYNAVFNSLYQLLPPINMLGRVNTFVDSLIVCAMPLGGLAGGYLASQFSAQYILLIYALVIIGSATYYFFVPAIRQMPKIDFIVREEE